MGPVPLGALSPLAVLSLSPGHRGFESRWEVRGATRGRPPLASGVFPAGLRVRVPRISLRRVNGRKNLFRFLACVALTVSAFVACGSNNDTSVAAPSGPPTLAIASISVGTIAEQPGAAPVLSCTGTIGVVVQVDNWTLRPRGACSVPQCGQVRVTLSAVDHSVIVTKEAASTGVDLDVSSLLAQGASASGTYDLKAELIGDDGRLFEITDVGNNSAETSFDVVVPRADECAASSGAAGAGGAPSSAGAAGAAGENSAGNGAGGDAAAGSGGASAEGGSAGQ